MKLDEERIGAGCVEHHEHKPLKGALVSGIGIAPARALFSFPNRLDHVGFETLGEALYPLRVARVEARGPRPDQGLIEEVLDIAVGHDFPIDVGSARAGETNPL